MEKIAFGGWSNCLRLGNREIEIVATTDVGPRIIRCGFIGEENLFAEFSKHLGRTGGDRWLIYGGHRFWHAPEDPVRTYQPDNDLVEYEYSNDWLRLSQPFEPVTGMQKKIDVYINPDANHVSVIHTLANRGSEAVELAPWALSVMAPGGWAAIPQEPFVPHPQGMLPARSFAVWPYASMADPRVTWGKKFVFLRQDSTMKAPIKLGFMNRQGYSFYTRNGYTILIRTQFDPAANYPDYQSNFELFTNSDMLEVETLGGLTKINPGEERTHRENWFLFRRELPTEEEALYTAVEEMLRESQAVLDIYC